MYTDLKTFLKELAPKLPEGARMFCVIYIYVVAQIELLNGKSMTDAIKCAAIECIKKLINLK